MTILFRKRNLFPCSIGHNTFRGTNRFVDSCRSLVKENDRTNELISFDN